MELKYEPDDRILFRFSESLQLPGAQSARMTLGARVRLTPFSVLPLMKLVNNTPTTITCSVKRAYAGKDLGRWAARYGAR